MYLAGQSPGNDLGESAADDVIVIENEERPGSTTESRQPTATSSSTRDLETHSMQQHPSAQRLRNDEDDDDEQEEEEELPGDNVTCSCPFFVSFLNIYIYVSLLKELVLVLRDGKTRAAKSNVDRLGQFPFEVDAVPDRVPPHLGLHFLPSARHLNLPLLALSRDIGMAIRYDDIQHDRTHTFTFTFMYIYYVQYIRTLHFLVLNIYMRYYLIINIYYFTFNVAFAKRTLSPNGLSPNHLQFLSFIKIKCACCEVWLYNIQLFLIIFVYWRIQDGLEVNSLVAWDTWKRISFSRSRSRNIFLRNITPSTSSSLGSIAISLTNRNLESPSRAPSITLHILLFTEHFRCVAYRYMYVRPYLIFFFVEKDTQDDKYLLFRSRSE